jgi:hypothetical protein
LCGFQRKLFLGARYPPAGLVAARPGFFAAMKNLTNWTRLAQAAADARDDLRSLVPALDRTIGEKKPDHPAAGDGARRGYPPRGGITLGA